MGTTSAVIKFLLGSVKPALELSAAGYVVGDALATHTDLGARVSNGFKAAFNLGGAGEAVSAPGGTPPLLPPPVGGASHAHAPVPAGTPPIGCACQHAAPVGAAPPAVPAVPAGTRLACPACPPIVAGAGESVQVSRCKTHEAELVGRANGLDLFYVGWAEAFGVDPAVGYASCGPKPQQNEKRFRTFWNNLDEGPYFEALSKWQTCTTGAKAADVKQKHDAKHAQNVAVNTKHEKDQKIARGALAAQKKKYEDQAAALVVQQSTAKSAEERAALQKQIDGLTQKAADAAALAQQINVKASSDAQAAQIAQLSKEVADHARGQGGDSGKGTMDSMLQMVMMQRMGLFPQQPTAAAPMMPVMQDGGGRRGGGDGGGQQQPIFNVNIPAPEPAVLQLPLDPYATDGEGWGDFLAGAADAPLDPDLAAEFGLSGIATIGDARDFYNLRNEFGPTMDAGELEGIRLAYVGAAAGVGACNSGCGIPFPSGV